MTSAFVVVSSDDSSSNTSGKAALRRTPVRANANRPVAAVPADQLYYWTRAWQENERVAAAEIEAGHVHSFETPADAVRWLLADD